MAELSPDKMKRFRLHVVEEIYRTEKEYTGKLEFTVSHLLAKAKEKGEMDNSFTEEAISTMFCNIPDILALHQRLVEELDRCMPNGPAYTATIAQCYVKFSEEFAVYKSYGENNEQAQKLLYVLEEQPAFKAFFVAAMLLGGQGDDTIDSYLFKPIQRICKYPLLFRELEKYTPEGHPDRAATLQALAVMKEVCSLINEAKRRVEKLEAIADLQATIEGWEGSNATDTCNELIKEGSLIKISAGNTQERMFYLFDNLLVYCKKSLMGQVLQFRGRIPVNNLDIENIEDGTADYLTNGIRVEHSWKVRNTAKNKWFVLIARTREEKGDWMEAMRRERGKRRRLAASRAEDTRNVILEKSEKLYSQAKKNRPLMRDHRLRLRTYTKCFTGEEMVQWLTENGEASNSEQAVILGQALLENGVIHHVNDRHQFKKSSDLLYRFRYDDGTYRGKFDSTDLVARGVRIYCRLHSLFDPLIREQRVGIRQVRCVVNAQKLLDWLKVEGDIQRREEGVALGQELFATGIIRHAADEQNFRDGSHYYRFTADDGHEGGKEKSRDVCSGAVMSCITLTLPFSQEDGGYGVTITNTGPPVIESSSLEAQLFGVCPGLPVLAINRQYINQASPEPHLLAQLAPPTHDPPSLSLTVGKKGSEYVTLTPTGSGLGFHIKGSSPVIINRVDKGSVAAKAGLLPGCCVLKVGDKDVLKLSHEAAVQSIKDALASSAGEEDGAKVKLKLSFGHMEQVASYYYSTSAESQVKVFDQTVESAYCFELPAKLLSLYAHEAEELVSHLSASEVKETRVSNYCTELATLITFYKKANTFLGAPRWPSYRPFGTMTSPVLSACPINLHTSVLDIVTTSSSPDRPSTPVSGDSLSEGEQNVSEVYTSYFITTMAVPLVANKAFTVEDSNNLGHAHIRRELLQSLKRAVVELEMDSDLADRLVEEMNQPNGPPSPPSYRRDSMDSPKTNRSFLKVPGLPKLTAMDLTPASTPILRHRLVSIGSPLPVVKLLADSLLSKVASLKQLLENKLLLSVLEEADHLMPLTGTELVGEFVRKLDDDCRRLKVATVSHTPGEALSMAASDLIATAEEYAQSISTRLEVSLTFCDNVDLLQTYDKLFSQLLTSLATSFAHQLMAAAKARLNTGVEYEPCNHKASQSWLQLIASKGVLVHLQSTMDVQKPSELVALKDLLLVAQQLSSVVLHIIEQPEDGPYCNCDLPTISLAGCRSELHISFALSPAYYQNLPDSLVSPLGVKVHPVLFNKGLMDINEGSEAYLWEKELNDSSFIALKDYYRSLRAFRLDRSLLPDDRDARKHVLSAISQPLNAMDDLVRQLEVAIRSPMRSGVGLLTIAAELLSRIGALRINICDSGVFRSAMATSLEQVILLARCHGLPSRSLRTAVNALRQTGSFNYIARKNNADIAISLPKQPPKLYQLPPEPSKTV